MSKLDRGKKAGSEEPTSEGGPGSSSSANGGIPEDWMSRGGWDESSGQGSTSANLGPGPSLGSSSSSSSNLNPWGETSAPGPARRQLSFDPGSGVIALSDEGNVWDDPESEGDDDDDHSGTVSPVSISCSSLLDIS